MRYLGRTIDFAQPPGAPSFCAPDSVTWRIFKNQVVLGIGGIAAVILELAEPRVRHGVWDHSSFARAPLARMRRTGSAAMVTVYAAREDAEAVIARISRMHERVTGTTPCGLAYRANDPDLLAWVQATASFGFLEAYCAFVAPLEAKEKDRFYGESEHAANTFGTRGAPRSVADQSDLFRAMQPRLGPSDILTEFLGLVRGALPMPGFLADRFIRAAISILPPDIRATLDLGNVRLTQGERRFVTRLARAADRLPIPGSPPVRACQRMGLPGNWLYRSPPETLATREPA